MKTTVMTVVFLAFLSLVGCSSHESELENARAQVEAGKAELAKAKADADAAKAEERQLRAKLAALGSMTDKLSTEDLVLNAAREFFVDVRRGFMRSAYDRMSVTYQKGTDRKGFEELIAMNPGFTRKWSSTNPLATGGPPASRVPISEHRVTKVVEDSAYEIDCLMDNSSQIMLRLIKEDGGWKIEDFLKINDRKQ